MNTDYTTQIENNQHERELVESLERRRIAADRAAASFDGDRLALLAHLARAARRDRSARGTRVVASPISW
jgi:hypothetical protein